jgi:hypothetical protein
MTLVASAGPEGVGERRPVVGRRRDGRLRDAPFAMSTAKFGWSHIGVEISLLPVTLQWLMVMLPKLASGSPNAAGRSTMQSAEAPVAPETDCLLEIVHPSVSVIVRMYWSQWGDRGDLNPRPPGPQPGALTN